MELYTDRNPESTIKNTGYKNKEIALKTIELIKSRSILYQKTVIITMRYRAYYHRSKTPDMNKAIKVFDRWLKKNKNKPIKYPYKKLKDIKFDKTIKIPKKVLSFYNEYKKTKGNSYKLAFRILKSNKYDYDILREKLIDQYLKLSNSSRNKKILELLAYDKKINN